MHSNDRILPGVALMICFALTAPLLDAFSKLAVREVSVGMVTLGRYVVQGALMLPVMLALGQPLRLSGRALGLTLARSAVSILSTYCFVAALRVMPMADALAIAFVEPFIILLIARLALKEHVGPHRLYACFVGFLGCLLVIQPSFAHFGAVALLPLGTAFFFALYILITRSLSQYLTPVAMQFHTALLAGLMCLPLLAIGHGLGEPSLRFAAPHGIFWLWCFGVGFIATFSHLAMTFALRFAPSSTLAPLHYLEIVTTTLLGYMIFGDFPNALSWAGIAIIVSSGLYIIHRERINARRATASAALTEAP